MLRQITSILIDHSILQVQCNNELKKIFLIKKPLISTVPCFIGLMNCSTINGVNLLKNFTTDQLNEYYTNIQRGTLSYNNYIKSGDLTTLISK